MEKHALKRVEDGAMYAEPKIQTRMPKKNKKYSERRQI